MSPREAGAPAAERLARLVAVSRRLAGQADLHEVLHFLLESAIALTGAERGFFLFRRGTVISCEAAAPGTPSAPGPVPPQLSRSVLGHVLDTGEGILSTEVSVVTCVSAVDTGAIDVTAIPAAVEAAPIPGEVGPTADENAPVPRAVGPVADDVAAVDLVADAWTPASAARER